MTRKRAYNSSPDGKLPRTVGPSPDLVDKDSSTETGGRGFNLVEMTSDFDVTNPEIYEKLKFESMDQSADERVFDMLVELGDLMDSDGSEIKANFLDFLIRKFAESREPDYSELFNRLMMKVNNADIPNTNDVLKKLARIYSRTLVLENMKTQDLNKSKESAYKKCLHRAEQYLSEV